MQVASVQAALVGTITREELACSMYQEGLGATRGGRRLISVQSEVAPAMTAAKNMAPSYLGPTCRWSEHMGYPRPLVEN